MKQKTMAARKKKCRYGSLPHSLGRSSTSEPTIPKRGKGIPIPLAGNSSGGTYGRASRKKSRKGHSMTYPPSRAVRRTLLPQRHYRSTRSTPKPRVPRTKCGTAEKRRYKIPPRIFHRNIQVRRLENIDWVKESQERAGVIPYIESKDSITFCLGVDALYGTLTDFGGGVKQTKESTLDGALRELEEESLGVIDRETIDLSTAVVVSSDKMAVIFARLTSRKDLIDVSFENALPDHGNVEVSSISWLDESSLRSYLKPTSKILYDPVKNLLSGNLPILLPALR